MQPIHERFTVDDIMAKYAKAGSQGLVPGPKGIVDGVAVDILIIRESRLLAEGVPDGSPIQVEPWLWFDRSRRRTPTTGRIR